MSGHKKESKSGEIWVNKFTEESASQFREEILNYASKSGSVPIVVYIDSYGGSVDALAKMVGTIQHVANPIVTYCLGKAMSCGAILLSYGDYRYCDPLGRVMIHEVSSGTSGDVHDNKNNAEESLRLNELFIGALARNCEIKGGFKGLRKLIKEHDGRELWLSAEAALEFGIVDEIGVPRIVPQISYELVTITPPTRKQRQERAKTILGLE